MTRGNQMLNTKPTVSLKEANHKTVCFVYKGTGTETSQTSSSLPGTQCLLCNSENPIKGGSTTLPLPCSGAFGLCFVEQSHHRLKDKLVLSSSTWCAHKGSLRSCPRGRPWSPQPNFRHSKGSLDPSCPNVRPPLSSAMSTKLMHAIQYDSYGGGPSGLKHVEVPIPTPKKNEVLLKLEAASLNPVDWKIQKGQLRPLFPGKFPQIPATDVAGEIVEVGQGAKKFKVGDKVVVLLSHFSGGGLAEFASSNERFMVARPAEVSAAEGAGLPVAGITAHQAITQSAGIKLDGTGKQKNILITAASGGVGHYAVQLAKLGNTHVTATCGARNVELVKSLGADEVLDYKTPDGAALKSPSGRKYDAVINCATGIAWSTFEPNLSAKGKVIDIAPNASSFTTFLLKKLTFSKKSLVPLLMIPKAESLDYLVKLVKEGKLKTVIDSKHPISKAEDAWAKSIDGHATGKIIVEP